MIADRRSWGILRGRFRTDELATPPSPPARNDGHSYVCGEHRVTKKDNTRMNRNADQLLPMSLD
jgi:hypothetical protein